MEVSFPFTKVEYQTVKKSSKVLWRNIVVPKIASWFFLKRQIELLNFSTLYIAPKPLKYKMEIQAVLWNTPYTGRNDSSKILHKIRTCEPSFSESPKKEKQYFEWQCIFDLETQFSHFWRPTKTWFTKSWSFEISSVLWKVSIKASTDFCVCRFNTV